MQEIYLCAVFMESSRPQDPKDLAVCFALYSTMHMTLKLYRDLLKPWGLTYQQVLVLSAVMGEQEATPGQIAHDLMLDSSTVSGLLKRLERDGLLLRDVDPEERRRVIVRPTDRALEIFSELGALGGCVESAMTLSPEQKEQLIGLLRQLRTGIREYG